MLAISQRSAGDWFEIASRAEPAFAPWRHPAQGDTGHGLVQELFHETEADPDVITDDAES